MILRLEAACNNHCRLCTGWLPPGSLVSPTLGESVTDGVDGSSIPVVGRESTLLRGREPTMVADLLSVLKRFAPVVLHSNARRFAYDHFTRRLAPYLARVVVSIHGSTPQRHDWFTRTPGSFDEMREGLANLRGLSIPVTVRVVLGRHNVADLDLICDLARDMGADRIRFVMLPGGCVTNFATGSDSTLMVAASVAGPFVAAALRRAWHNGMETEVCGLSAEKLVGLSSFELQAVGWVESEPREGPDPNHLSVVSNRGRVELHGIEPAGQEDADRAAPAWFDASTGQIRAVVRTTCRNACQFCTTRIIHEEAGLAWPRDRTGDFLSQLLAALGPWATRSSGRDVPVVVRMAAMEPAEHPDIDIMVAAAVSWTGARVQIDSSGRRFADAVFTSRLIDLGVGRVDLLLLGPNDKVHDLVAGSRGAFDDLVSGIENLAGRVELTGHIVVVRDNADSVIDTLMWARAMAVHVTHVSFAAPASRDPVRYEKVAVFLPEFVSRLIRAGADGMEVLALATAELPPCLLPGSVTGTSARSSRRTVRLTHPENFSIGVGLKERGVCPLAQRCDLADQCPGLFPQYLELFGTKGLVAVR